MVTYTVVARDGVLPIECRSAHVEGPGMRNGALVGLDLLLPDDDKCRRTLAMILSVAYEAGRAAKAREIREAING